MVRNSDVQESRNSGKQRCVLLALSPQTFHKSGMAASVHSFTSTCCMAIAIYLPVLFNASWLDTSKIPYSNLGAANCSLCPRNYSRAFTAWFTWMSVSEGVCCNFWVQINGRKFQPQESRIDLQGRQSP